MVCMPHDTPASSAKQCLPLQIILHTKNMLILYQHDRNVTLVQEKYCSLFNMSYMDNDN